MPPYSFPTRPGSVTWGQQGSTHYLMLTGREVDRSLPPVVFLHAYGTDDWRGTLAANVTLGLHSLRSVGHAIFVPETGASWCHPTAASTAGGTGLQSIDDVLTAAEALGFDTSVVHLAGVSMGGGNAMAWAMHNPDRVGGVRIFVPVYDLGRMRDQAGYRPSIDTVWGTTGQTRSQFLDACAAYDPAQRPDLMGAIGDKVSVFADRSDAVINWSGLVEFCALHGIELTATTDAEPGLGHIFFSLSDRYDELDILRWFAARPAA